MPPPPAAKAVARDVTVHGDKRVDPYFWLRERDNPEVIGYLEAENRYTETVMADTKPGQEALYREMVGRIQETDLEVPVRHGDYFYYKRTEEGKQYPIYCRKRGRLEAEEEIILDQNELAEGKNYFRLGVFKISPNHQLLAYSVDTTGAETYTLHVKDLQKGTLLRDQIPNTYYSVEWANDNKTLFYNTLDEARRPFKLFRHTLGVDAANDQLIHFEEDEAYFLSVYKTKSKAYLMLELESNTTSEVWYLDANRPAGRFKVIHPRQHKMEYAVEHHGDRFFIMTNDDAINFKVMQVRAHTPGKQNWRELIPHRQSVKIDGIEPFKNHLVVYERERGLEQIAIIDLTTDEKHYVQFDEPAYSIRTTSNPEFDTNVVRFKYSSLTTPESVFDYDMANRTRELKKQKEVLGDYVTENYEIERIFARAPDGEEIPISLVYREGLKKNGRNPFWLYGYGSYGHTIEPAFNSNRLSLLDRGFVFAIAHIRGGGAMGRPWYENGKLFHKKNTFTDFIACAEHLIAENYTDSQHLVISGGSAGGLLMGAVLNMRPDLFKAAVAKVPFVDVVNTMLDASIPLTVIEYEEWGNPNEKEYYDYIKSYSPYDNVEAKAYPNILITAGLNDPRVQYWEPAKWTAKLRALKTDDNLLLLKTNMGAGHGGASGRYDYLKEIAFEYAFVFKVLGIGV
ncbi:MAG: S9 family peptidase [bacterium]